MSLKNLEYLRIENQTTEFPKHFHETFCISLIHKGTEQIDFENHSLFSEAGCISITNPFEIHANPLIDSTTQLKFDTIYIPNSVMQLFFEGKNIAFTNQNRKIKNEKANQLFTAVTKAIDSQNIESIHRSLKSFLTALKLYSQESDKEYTVINFKSFHAINSYIENNIYDKFSLDVLSKIAHINKYGFAKKFKASTGMTPMNYVLMRKIFSSKNGIQKDSELTSIAYQYNFTDMAHYSKTFKRYIGISPKQFQENLI